MIENPLTGSQIMRIWQIIEDTELPTDSRELLRALFFEREQWMGAYALLASDHIDLIDAYDAIPEPFG